MDRKTLTVLFQMSWVTVVVMHLPQKWIGHAGASDVTWSRWPLRMPHLIPHEFLWDYVKNKVFNLPPQQSLPELRQRIKTAIASITRDSLHKVWDELDYHLNICHVTCRTRNESLCSLYTPLIVFLLTGVGMKSQVCHICFLYHFEGKKKKVKWSHYMPWRHFG
jgi:hypothetical protein